MLLVAALAIGLWGLGALMKAPRSQRLALIGLLLGAVILGHLVLPEGNALRASTGGSVAPWLILLGLGGLVSAYSCGLVRLRRRVAAVEAPAPSGGLFTETELERYARHIVLREIGGPGQAKLKRAKVLVIGAGGLGAPALQYLAAAGVGTIGVIDDDVVENANLQRQVIHRDADIGLPKVFSAEAAMLAQNPHVSVRPYHRRLEISIAEELFDDYDVILDGTDNFDTRYLANRTAVTTGKPLISGALSQWEGQLSVFYPANGTPCYQCIFPQSPAPGLAPSCAEAGVLGPLPGILGSMMAAEAIKIVTGAGQPLYGAMAIHDALYGESRHITLKRRPDCPVCGAATV